MPPQKNAEYLQSEGWIENKIKERPAQVIATYAISARKRIIVREASPLATLAGCAVEPISGCINRRKPHVYHLPRHRGFHRFSHFVSHFIYRQVTRPRSALQLKETLCCSCSWASYGRSWPSHCCCNAVSSFANFSHIDMLSLQNKDSKFTKDNKTQWSSAARVSMSTCTNPWYMTYSVLPFPVIEPTLHGFSFPGQFQGLDQLWKSRTKTNLQAKY